MARTNIKIRIADWNNDNKMLATIRRQVFIDEQNVPEELEWDKDDNTSTHFIASIDNKPIATARLTANGQIGRMAVLAEYRNQGVGKKLLHFVLQHVASISLKQVFLHAQITAIPFYEKQGFTAFGHIFYEANIPHREMSLKIC